MLNHWVGMGRLVRDPEMRSTYDGKAVASFSLAIDRDYEDQSGKRPTDFIPCTAFGSQADFARKYLKKGRQFCVVGRWQQQNWKDQNGNKRTSWNVIVQSFYFADSGKSTNAEPSAPAEAEFTELDDDGTPLPF
ncbi:MAG: single-stranded DNA-binding protein [Ruminiclostridium sp.]|nr:single-stranded DNA-binding protein [Ruminiclostridium sp.]